MSYIVVITDTAKQDLREIALWIAEQSKDIEIAKHFVNELRENARSWIDSQQHVLFPKIVF